MQHNDEKIEKNNEAKPSAATASDADKSPSTRSYFPIPTPLKRIFDSCPLITYPANALPVRAPRRRDVHTLYIFTSDAGAQTGAPSFNPSCLKWQTYLHLCGVPFRTVASSNHASPSGALPFLLPAGAADADDESAYGHAQPLPVPAGRLRKWVRERGWWDVGEGEDPRREAYAALVDTGVRNAWLYALYLDQTNFRAIAEALYVQPSTSNEFVRWALARTLRAAARSAILQSPPQFTSSPLSDASSSATNSRFGNLSTLLPPPAVIDAEVLYERADEAFAALSELLGDENEWFFSGQRPGLFDATVFAYTYLILNEDRTMGNYDWREDSGVLEGDGAGDGQRQMGLRSRLRKYGNLMRHAGRIREMCFP